jgi:hypothetical protein
MPLGKDLLCSNDRAVCARQSEFNPNLRKKRLALWTPARYGGVLQQRYLLVRKRNTAVESGVGCGGDAR